MPANNSSAPKASSALMPVFEAGQIEARIAELGGEITKVYAGAPLVAVCVLKGAFMFFADLVRKIDNPSLETDFVRLSSYGKNSVSSRHIIFNKDIEADIFQKHVLIVEDIVDTGHTMRFLLDQFAARKPLSLRIAALLDKYERREVPINVDFTGFKMGSGFLVGYGLDYGEHFRNLPSIFELSPDYLEK